MENSQWIHCAVFCNGNHRYNCALKAEAYFKLVAKPPCPDRSSRWPCATGPFCLLALQGNWSYWAFFPQGLIFLFWHLSACATSASYLQVLGEGGSSHQHSYYPKRSVFQTQGLEVARRSSLELQGILVCPMGAVKPAVLVLNCCSPLLLGRKRKGIPASLLMYCFKSIPFLPLGPFTEKDGESTQWGFVEHKLFCPRCLAWLGYSLPQQNEFLPLRISQSLFCKCFLLWNLYPALVLSQSGSNPLFKVIPALNSESW